jgi:hypothetical protein
MTISSIVLGLFVLIFGLNKFLNFLPMLDLSPEAGAYFGALTSAKVMTLVAVVEIVSGLALITNKYGALLSIVLMSISVNAVLFHATLAPESIGPALLLLILNIIALYNYKDSYKGLL